MIENDYKDARDFLARFLEQQQEQQVVLLMTMLLLLLVLMTLLLHVLTIATAHSMLVSATNQKRAVTSSSLKIEEVEERPCTNQDGCHTGIEPGACS